MDTALPQKFPDLAKAKANCTENQVSTSCDTVVLGKDANWIAHFNIEGLTKTKKNHHFK